MRLGFALLLTSVLSTAAFAQATPATTPDQATPSAAAAPAGDIPAKFVPPTDAYDYDKREVMIPMRDGVKLHTVSSCPRARTTRLSC